MMFRFCHNPDVTCAANDMTSAPLASHTTVEYRQEWRHFPSWEEANDWKTFVRRIENLDFIVKSNIAPQTKFMRWFSRALVRGQK